MDDIAKDYFVKLFMSQGMENTNHIMSGVERRIKDNMNSTLMVEYIINKVYAALKDMAPMKAPDANEENREKKEFSSEGLIRVPHKDDVENRFTDSWIPLIMRCINSVSYVVEINGEVGEVFKLRKGLNGGLLALLRLAKEIGQTRGAKVSR
ncbi:reverse transcriptase [Gossypium australe]|uniref:Reverse transcriptase n=1 Tax=Gossypium australe TaxID=47621 RepID=A0A5B6U8U7_9ROSI|nr:reverse transcriptase [Gossypium australe]